MNLQPVLAATGRIFGTAPVMIQGAGRCRELALPRFAFYLVVRQQLGLSLPSIGRFMGKRDHTTVMHGIERARDLIDRDAEFAEKVEALRKSVQEMMADNLLTPAPAVHERLSRRVGRYVLQSLERLAIENPKGFDQLVLRAGSNDPSHHF
jgi:hypothetical protein